MNASIGDLIHSVLWTLILCHIYTNARANLSSTTWPRMTERRFGTSGSSGRHSAEVVPTGNGEKVTPSRSFDTLCHRLGQGMAVGELPTIDLLQAVPWMSARQFPEVRT